MRFITARTLFAAVFVTALGLPVGAFPARFSPGTSACGQESTAPSLQCRRHDDAADATRGDHPHVRVEDKKLRTFVLYDFHLIARSSGALTFVGSVAGIRYVLIKVGYVGVAANQVALVGHELRHAVEVADMQRITDVPSFHREYARVGFPNPFAADQGSLAFETHDAIRAGEQIARELRTGT